MPKNNVFRLLLEDCPSVECGTSLQRQKKRDGGREVMNSNRHFPFKVEAVCVSVCVIAHGGCLSLRAGESLSQPVFCVLY